LLTISALRESVELPAAALELPVSVNVQETAPATVTTGALDTAVKPFGTPDAIERIDPAAPVGIATPPSGVAVTVTVAVASDCTETDAGDATSCTPAACCTCNVTFWVTTRPSPVADTEIVAEPTVAVDEAVSVSVALLVNTFDAGTIGLALQLAVTPVGRPLMERAMFPLKDPPVVAVKPTVPRAPWATVTEFAAAASVSVGACVTFNP
jgi:hypothetical protein